MKKIVKRFLKKDSQGKELYELVEEVLDDDSDNINYNKELRIATCETCSRPIENINEIRGYCEYCGNESRLCIHCASLCKVCGRTICPRCKRGFNKDLTCCPDCYEILLLLKITEDRRAQEKIDFERIMTVEKHKLDLLNSKFFDNYPAVEIIRQIAGYQHLRNLQALEKRIRRLIEE